MNELMEEIKPLMPKGKMNEVNALVERELKEGVPAQTILQEGLLQAMDIIAKKWADGTAFIPEVLITARCMNAAIPLLEPYLLEEKEAESIRGEKDSELFRA